MPVDSAVGLPAFVLGAVLVSMVIEWRLSQANERRYRQQGAIDVVDPVYGVMRWAYPGAFVLMALEGALRGIPIDGITWTGAGLFLAAKALKAWAIRTLGPRWTYRVLVLRGAPLVVEGPYAFLQHPNYVGVVGELVGMGLMMHARIAGPVATVFFIELLRRRIAAEERGLGIRS